ncbi:uncharacterized protein LOC126657187 [Mercurialis annua]|uniref:uncharacterized protein LOC126657187 n=1 Tax=Mercurialis annua TaxID=3986 RepID=UPI00216075F7|nr:uncharacterized protein LOC126657187 [Mercurialis annua]
MADTQNSYYAGEIIENLSLMQDKVVDARCKKFMTEAHIEILLKCQNRKLELEKFSTKIYDRKLEIEKLLKQKQALEIIIQDADTEFDQFVDNLSDRLKFMVNSKRTVNAMYLVKIGKLLRKGAMRYEIDQQLPVEQVQEIKSEIARQFGVSEPVPENGVL